MLQNEPWKKFKFSKFLDNQKMEKMLFTGPKLYNVKHDKLDRLMHH